MVYVISLIVFTDTYKGHVNVIYTKMVIHYILIISKNKQFFNKLGFSCSSNYPLNYLHWFNLINTSLGTFSRLVLSFIYVTDSPYEIMMDCCNYIPPPPKPSSTHYPSIQPPTLNFYKQKMPI